MCLEAQWIHCYLIRHLSSLRHLSLNLLQILLQMSLHLFYTGKPVSDSCGPPT